MQRTNDFIFTWLPILLIGLLTSCQSRQTYVSDQLGIIIHYPSEWTFLEETDLGVMLRSHYSGEATLHITTIENSADADLRVLMQEEIDSFAQGSDQDMSIVYGEIDEQVHGEYEVVTGFVAGHSQTKVSAIDPLWNAYKAVIRFQDRVVVVTAVGAGHQSQQNAIKYLLDGLEFQ